MGPIRTIHLSQQADLKYPIYLFTHHGNITWAPWGHKEQPSFIKKIENPQVSPFILKILADTESLYLELNIANYFRHGTKSLCPPSQ